MADAATTLQELLNPPTFEQLVDLIYAYLQKNNFPVSDYTIGGVERTRTQAWIVAMQDFAVNYVPELASGGYIDLASGPWLQLLASQRFLIDYNPASNTVGKIVFANTSTNAYSLQAGQMIIQFGDTGNRYFNVDAYTIAASSDTTLSMVSEFPNDSSSDLNYTDVNNSAINLVTSFPGVTATNPGATFSVVSHAGSGTGTLSMMFGSPPSISYQILIQIMSTGQAGGATWKYSINGASFIDAGNASSLMLSGTTLTVTLNNSINPSFIINDVYQFSSPGSWITTQGADVETDPALQSRCKNRWPTLSKVPTLGLYDELARAADAQVTITTIRQDAKINNKVDIYIAGQGGVLPEVTIQKVQGFINDYAPITDYPVVFSPVAIDITLIAGIVYNQAYVNQNSINISSEVEDRLTSYINSIGIDGTIRISEMVAIMQDSPGVKYVDFSQPLTINASESDFIVEDANGSPALANISNTTYTGLVFIAK